MMPRAPHVLAILACLSLATAGCPSSSGRSSQRPDAHPRSSSSGGNVVETRPSAPDPVVDGPLAAADALEKAGKHKDALAAYTAILTQHPNTSRLPDVLLGAGRAAQRMGDRVGARATLERLAVEYPTHNASAEAKLLLASLDLEEGRVKEGVSGMKNAMDALPAQERADYSAQMGRALMDAHEFSAAMLPLAQAEAALPAGPAKTELQERIFSVVDQHLTPMQMLSMREQLPPKSHGHTLLTLKLARVYVHMGEDPRAAEELKAFLSAAPDHPLAAGAQALLKLLSERSVVATHRLGVVLPTSGRWGATGERVLAALKMGLADAAQEAARKKGQPTLPVEVVVMDDKGDAEEAARAVDGLVADHKVMAVTGAISVAGSATAAVRAEALHVPLLAMARREGLAQMGPYTFSFALTDEHQARELARVTVTQLGFKRVALLYPRFPRGVALTNAFWDELEAAGGSVAGVESYDHDQTTFTTPIRKLVGRHFLEARGEYTTCMAEARQIAHAYKREKAEEACEEQTHPLVDFDAIFIADWYKPVTMIAPALAVEDIFVGNDERALRQFKQTTGQARVRKVILLGTNGFNAAELPRDGGKYVEGAIFVDGFHRGNGRPETVAFVGAFTKATGSPPELREAQAYDAGRMLGLVFADNPQSRDAFRQALGSLKNQMGVTGQVSFDPDGAAITPLHVFTIKGHSIVPAALEPATGG